MLQVSAARITLSIGLTKFCEKKCQQITECQGDANGEYLLIQTTDKISLSNVKVLGLLIWQLFIFHWVFKIKLKFLLIEIMLFHVTNASVLKFSYNFSIIQRTFQEYLWQWYWSYYFWELNGIWIFIYFILILELLTIYSSIQESTHQNGNELLLIIIELLIFAFS